MKRKFKTNNLYVGKLMYISNEVCIPGFILCEETALKYFFTASSEDAEIFREVFTGFQTKKSNGEYFNTFYATKLEKYLDYFPEEINQEISVHSLIVKLNEINKNLNKNQSKSMM